MRCVLFQPGAEFRRTAFPPFAVARQKPRKFEFSRNEIFRREPAQFVECLFRFRRNCRTGSGIPLLLLYAGVEQPRPGKARFRAARFRRTGVERKGLIGTLHSSPAAFETDREVVGPLRTALLRRLAELVVACLQLLQTLDIGAELVCGLYQLADLRRGG